jgi:DNA-binding NarL/FixJ family response regulator
VRESLVAELAGAAPEPVDALPRVLIVDAGGERAAALAAAVEPRARAHTTGDAAEALRLAADLRPDLVVLGPELEHAAPADLLSELRGQAGPATVVVAAVSADDAARARLLAAGAIDVLSPTAPPDELRSRLRLLLEHGSLRRRLEAAETALGRAAGGGAGGNPLPAAGTGGGRVGGNPIPPAATRR